MRCKPYNISPLQVGGRWVGGLGAGPGQRAGWQSGVRPLLLLAAAAGTAAAGRPTFSTLCLAGLRPWTQPAPPCACPPACPQLLAPPTHAITPAEFYQMWQALPHRAQLSATASEPGGGGLQRVLGAMGGGAMLCVLRGAAPAHGSAHAAFHGASWDGQRIACVVTGAVPLAAGGTGGGAASLAPPQHARVQFFFRSESAEVVAHVQVRSRACGLPRVGWLRALGHQGGCLLKDALPCQGTWPTPGGPIDCLPALLPLHRATRPTCSTS